MKQHHVESRLAKRAGARCQPACPGWIVRTNPGRPKLMACPACNGMHPERLQVTDRMVKLLPIAVNGLEAIKRQLQREKRERATTRHIASGYVASLCDRPLGRTSNSSRSRVHALATVTQPADCTECLRLQAMTQAEREQERRDRSKALKEKFAKHKEVHDREREERIQRTEHEIAEARVDAKVAWDILEEVDFDRSQLWIFDRDPTRFARNQERAMYVDRVLDMAVIAHLHANPKSRGERRWLFRPIQASVVYNDDPKTQDHRIICRFCQCELLPEGTLGFDYTDETNHHTLKCALEYLGAKVGMQANEEMREVIAAKNEEP